MSVLQNKVVVTGVASGIGLAIAERFAADGAKVVIADVKHEVGAPVVERLDGVFVRGDFSRHADCRALMTK